MSGVAVVPETDEAGALLGKLASELQSNLVVNNGVASGILKYVSDWTEFSSEENKQSGNYIALKVTGAPDDAVVTYKAKDSTYKPTTLDSERNIVILITETNSILEFTISSNGFSVVKEISLDGITLEPAPEA